VASTSTSRQVVRAKSELLSVPGVGRHLLVRMNEDRQWLSEFCASGSERAFRQIVERNLKLVFGTAMRLLNGDAHLAEDVAQTVFTNLALKARSLPQELVLAGWLHRDTRFTALEVLRKERRRKARELEAAAMHDAESQAHEVVWPSIQLILDELLDELEDEDRHALLLRYLEQRPLLAVGNALGIAEDTARKRVQRALEKLRRSLAARGITTTGGALGTILTSRGAEVVPAGLGARLVISALAKAGTTASSASLGTLMVSTKLITVTAATAVLLLAGISLVKVNRTPPGQDAAPESAKLGTESGTRRFLRGQWFGRNSRQNVAESSSPHDAPLGPVLERLQRALNDPKPTRRFPDEAIGKILASMGDRRSAAMPILLEALRNGSDLIRNRAADALGQIGPEARDAVPLLMQQLRDSKSPGLFMLALEKVAPSPDLVPELVATMRENAASRLTLANSLSSPIWGDTRSVSDAVRPLLQDHDPSTRQFAAYTLAALQRDQAGEDVRKITFEGLRSLDIDLQGLALSALHNLGSDPKDPEGRVTQERLGPSAVEAIPALIEIANQSARKDLQHTALLLLDALDPALRPENPGMERVLRSRVEAAGFEAHARAGQMSVPELVDGIHQYPDAIGGIAEVLAGLGPEAVRALPALHGALNALANGSDDSLADVARRSRDLNRVVDAIRRIAPDQPTPLFKESEVHAVLEVLDELEPGSDPNRGQRAKAAAASALSDLNGTASRLTADQMRRLLDALKTVEPSAYESAVAKVTAFSPGFIVPPKPR
jgi:RNA polymerase sigma factor (sigma-70 family)